MGGRPSRPKQERELPALHSDERDALFESIHEPILVLRPEDEVVLEANESACHLYGMSRDELIGTSMKDMSVNVSRGEAHVEQTLVGRHVFETEQRRADGALLHLEVSASRVLFDGEAAILSINRNISDRKLAEVILQAQAERIALSRWIGRAALAGEPIEAIAREALYRVRRRTQADGARVAMSVDTRYDFLVDLDDALGDTRFVVARRLGEQRGERYIPDLAHKPSKTPGEKAAGEEGFVAVFTCWLADGPRRLTLTLASRRRDAFDDATRGVVAALAEELWVAAGHLRLGVQVDRERARLRELVEHLPGGVVLLDEDDRLEVSNDLGRRLFAHVTKQGSVPNRHARHAVFDSDGRTIEVRARSLSGPPRSGTVMLLRDITDEQAVQAKLLEQQRLAAVGQLAAGIAHDFNNLLQGIGSLAEALHGTGASSEVDRGLAEIHAQVRRGGGVVRQILDFGRRSVSTREVTELTALMRRATGLLRHVIPTTITINGRLPNDPVFAEVDAVQLQQVITNLALNAMEAMPQGGALTLELLQGQDQVALRVSDTGAGIAPHVLPHIFEPFFTTKSTPEGTGLGLSQVYGIVCQHGGTVEVDTEPDEGSCFTITLPTCAPPRMPTSPAEAARRHDQRTGRVLLVEDDVQVQRSVRRMLRAMGYEVITASHGGEALAILEERPGEIDCVLTDVVMPVIDGLELCERLRRTHPELPIILASGHPLTETAKPFVHNYPWLHKPFTRDEVGRELDRALRRAAAH